jgi:excinuclease ABC subunit C
VGDREALNVKLRTLPQEPGVYLMKDARGKVIYVGKAARLAARVRNYFGAPDLLDPKTRTLVDRIADFDWIVVPSERDALLLEDQLVKEYKPKYNIRLKDDKRYPYLRLTTSEPFPRIDVVRLPADDGNEYYGPYTSARAMRLTLRTLTAILPIRTCTLALPEETVPRPCLDYHIDRCCAPCVDYVTREQYTDLVEQVRLFLQGRNDALAAELRRRMELASSELRFEDAAHLRDRIAAIDSVVERQRMVMDPGTDVDVLALEREGKLACGIVLRVRGGKLVRTEDYFFHARLEESEDDFFARFAAEVLQRSSQIGRSVLLERDLADAEQWSQVLATRHGRRVELAVPHRGDRAELVRMARTNARLKLREHLATEQPRKARGRDEVPEVLDLKQRLQLPVAPHTIECFDMSHFHGSQRVGSLVFFSGGQPLKSRYRRFRIKHVEGIDDFAMMQECLERYYSRLRDEDQLPADLVVVDGGAGQLGVAVRTLQRYGFVETAVIGLAKREEEVYVPGAAETVRLPRSSSALRLLQRIRDEAHRFAITYHRNLRDKETLHSVLDEIPGIGAVKRRSLLTHFGSAEAVGRARVDELVRVPGIGPVDAQRIVEFFLARGGAP